MRFKLKELVTLPKYTNCKEPIKWVYNDALEECGEIEVEVNEDFLFEIISKTLFYYYEPPRSDAHRAVAKAIAKKLPEILGKKD